MTIIISRVINLFSIFVFNLDRHTVPRDYILGKFPWRKRWDSDINSWLVVSAERHEYWERKAWKVGGATVKLLITALDLISLSSNSATVFWSIIELFIGELNNQGRCNRHARQLYGSAAGNSGDFFFSPLVFANLWFFAPNFIFLRKWRQWRSVTRTLLYDQRRVWSQCAVAVTLFFQRLTYPSKTRDLAPFWLCCPQNLHLRLALMSLKEFLYNSNN